MIIIFNKTHLLHFVHSQNMLTSLPDDFFENMPSLTDVNLDKNKFTTLSEKPFSVLLRYVQQLSMSGKIFYYEYIRFLSYIFLYNCLNEFERV